MAVFVDQMRDCLPNRKWRHGQNCHLMPQGRSPAALQELHEFAGRLGLKPAWFQRGTFPHYDLTVGKRWQALRLGAVPVETNAELRTHLARLREVNDERGGAQKTGTTGGAGGAVLHLGGSAR